jgi:PAS domain-containing protein
MDMQTVTLTPAKATEASSEQPSCAEKSFFMRDDPPALSMDEDGMIHDCSRAFEVLFGFLREDIIEQHISRFFPQLCGVELIQSGQFNPLLNYLCRCGHLFRVQNRGGDTLAINLNFVHVGYDGSRILKMFVRPPREVNA